MVLPPELTCNKPLGWTRDLTELASQIGTS